MLFGSLALLGAAPVTLLGVPVFLWEGLLDLLGLAAAIWSLWVLAWLDLEAALRGAFRWIVAGGLTFALLHLQDTLLRLGKFLNGGLINLIHIGSMLVVLVFLVLVLARLADAATSWQTRTDGTAPLRLWPLAVGTAVTLGAFSFILYGLSTLAVAWAAWALQASLVLLTIACAAQVLRARLGGSVGRALRWALFGLLVFSLVHPIEAWLISIQALAPLPYASLLHRVFVIPAFLLFSIGISALSRAWAPKEPLLPSGKTSEISRQAMQGGYLR
jgi:hypothetical protein